MRSDLNDGQSTLRFEKIPTAIYPGFHEGSVDIAFEVAGLIRGRQSLSEGCRLAFGTGPAMYAFYEELVRMHQEESLSFSNVDIFQITEYFPISNESVQSAGYFLHKHFLDHVDLPSDRAHLFDGSIFPELSASFCRDYEQSISDAGGLDLIVLGLGHGGSLGYNIQGTPAETQTRIVILDRATITSAASDFFSQSHVPRKAFTMGLNTMMSAGRVLLVAWGESMAPVIRQVVEMDQSDSIPAGIFQNHSDTRLLCDKSAAEDLTRMRTPWLVETPVWNDQMVRKAVVWLCQEIEKPILKLTDQDYNDYHMNELITEYGSAYNVNIKVFNELQHTITGWPGGKPDADDTNRPERARPAHKRVVIFSPHPDDDVISMGGTFIRLVDQGHEVHVAYQTSGNIAVFDEDVVQYTDLLKDLYQGLNPEHSEAEALFDKVREDLAGKKPGQADSNEVKYLKTCIRRSEARASCRLIGIGDERVNFLDMPFYDTGQISKSPLESADIDIVTTFLKSIKPHQIYAAGDLNDPHGTHRTCLTAIFESLKRLKTTTWINDCRVWLYRGAWHEWPVNEIDMTVPMSPDELARKRKAIFKHQSQKDSALFPGSDSREFWQRAEARNKGLANLYNRLGFAEYEAMEGFKRLVLPLTGDFE